MRVLTCLLLALLALPAAARAPGDVWHRCLVETRFDPVTGARGNRGDFIGGTAIVEADGRISERDLYRIEAGRLGWPDVGGDPDRFHIGAHYRGPAPFHADAMWIEIEMMSRRRLRQPLAFSLSVPGRSSESPLLATMHEWRHSAGVDLRWPGLRALAGERGAVDVMVSEVAPPGRYGRVVNSTTVDLGAIGRVIAALTIIDGELTAMAADAPNRCTRAVEPDADEVPEI